MVCRVAAADSRVPGGRRDDRGRPRSRRGRRPRCLGDVAWDLERADPPYSRRAGRLARPVATTAGPRAARSTRARPRPRRRCSGSTTRRSMSVVPSASRLNARARPPARQPMPPTTRVRPRSVRCRRAELRDAVVTDEIGLDPVCRSLQSHQLIGAFDDLSRRQQPDLRHASAGVALTATVHHIQPTVRRPV